ncbi:helix-turn-helix transcriptional regulator [Paenibacillus sp. CGMCC 1.18879]|uniref:helix-turn-helix transcriptional regulator n=1 Tax=Paenibacillus sp. CGMCC 1.18879 TaxID=2834466 RepID=UPI001CA9AAAE|nr:helix-turn-helix transcriptional regulator [Paenibacillus sp. CGMCC 1.18879]MBY9079603.1 helix-turn-helix transcriptional regulator [Paenibacillus sp. CGMCC 1.18879]
MNEWLKELRKKAQKTQVEMASLLDISQSHYCGIEMGTARPSIKLAQKISLVLKFHWTRFYEDEKKEVECQFNHHIKH